VLAAVVWGAASKLEASSFGGDSLLHDAKTSTALTDEPS
jgi:hypothetical protein